MLISDIIPYAKNAHQNAENIPKIADSIREFGFIGQIALESRANPVIVAGHHRVEACKLLGWTEIPDENIAWCDHLTEDQVKALRLADNWLGEGKWNRSMLREEVRTLTSAGFDMSRFSFDFKSKLKPYGAEKLRTDDSYNLDIVWDAHTDGRYDMPVLRRCDLVPDELLPFNYAKSAKSEDFGKTLHFFIDDYQFERIWNAPAKYLDLIRKFNGVIAPDFSIFDDMPLPMQQWNEYRRRALMNYWQRNGLEVIPLIRWGDSRSYGFCFEGLPKGGTFAASTVRIRRDRAQMKAWCDGMEVALDKTKPKSLVLYGGKVDMSFGNVRLIEVNANTSFKG